MSTEVLENAHRADGQAAGAGRWLPFSSLLLLLTYGALLAHAVFAPSLGWSLLSNAARQCTTHSRPNCTSNVRPKCTRATAQFLHFR
jgi:hypothetical protein